MDSSNEIVKAKHDHDTFIAIHTLTAEIDKLNQQQDKILDELHKKK